MSCMARRDARERDQGRFFAHSSALRNALILVSQLAPAVAVDAIADRVVPRNVAHASQPRVAIRQVGTSS